MEKAGAVLTLKTVRRDETRQQPQDVEHAEGHPAQRGRASPPQPPPEQFARREMLRRLIGSNRGGRGRRGGLHFYFNRMRGSLQASSRSATKFPTTSKPVAM